MVSIDTVYQNVLALANKEQRGYITPQEFNLFADQAQMEIFEQYFYDLNQWSRQPGNSTKYGDMLDLLNEKIDIFKNFDVNPGIIANGAINLDNIDDFYRINMVTVQYNGSDRRVIAEEQSRGEESILYSQSPLTTPTRVRPRYIKFGSVGNAAPENRIEIMPFPENAIDNVFISYIRTPNRPMWAYNVVAGKALFNGGLAVDFELHDSEQGELIHKILGYAGITLKNTDVVSTAVQLEKKKIQQEKI